MLCYAMPCHAMPCHAMPCHAMLCYGAAHARSGPRPRVLPEQVRLEVVEADAAQPRGCAREARLHHLGPQPDRLEDLRALVRLHRADADLRHDLEQQSVA